MRCRSPRHWRRDTVLRLCQGVCQVTTVLCGLATTLGMGWAATVFAYKCPLYANVTLAPVKLREREVDESRRVMVDDAGTTWGRVSDCEYATFMPAVAAIYASVWFWFYILLSRGSKYRDGDDDDDSDDEENVEKGAKMGASSTSRGDGRLTIPTTPYSPGAKQNGQKKAYKRPPDMQLMMPTILFNAILWVCAVVSLAFIDGGFRAWCTGITARLKDKSCSYTTKVTWVNYESGHMAYHYIVWALVGNWFLVLSILGTIVVVSMRLYDLLQDINQRRPSKFPPSQAPPTGPAPTATWFDQSYSNPAFDFSETDVDNGFVFVDVHGGGGGDGDAGGVEGGGVDVKQIKAVVLEEEDMVLRDSLKNAAKNAKTQIKATDHTGNSGEGPRPKSPNSRDHVKTVTDEGDGLKDISRGEPLKSSDTVQHSDNKDSVEAKPKTSPEKTSPQKSKSDNTDSKPEESEQLSLMKGGSHKSYQSLS